MFGDITSSNLKEKVRSCCKCSGEFTTKERVDTVNSNGTEQTFCFKDYDKALKAK